MHLALGLVVGAGFGFGLVRTLLDSTSLGLNQIGLMILGLALCGGAFASFYGDRAWTARSIFDRPEQPPTSEAQKASRIIGFAGLLVLLVPLTMSLLLEEPEHRHAHSAGSLAFRLVISAFPGFLVFHALRTGTFILSPNVRDRDETPIFFWGYVTVNAIGFLCFAFGH
jgi:hypothetical protein